MLKPGQGAEAVCESAHTYIISVLQVAREIADTENVTVEVVYDLYSDKAHIFDPKNYDAEPWPQGAVTVERVYPTLPAAEAAA